MIKTLKQIISIKASLWVNSFCYYFKRLWLIGKCMPDTVYSNYELKKILSVIAVILRQVIDFLSKPIYLLSFVVLPLFVIPNLHPEQRFPFMVQILFFLNCVIGSLGGSQIFTVTRDQVTCIKYLHMNSRCYVQAFLAFKYVPFFVYYMPWILISAKLLGASLVDGLFLWLMLLAFRMIGEAVQLLIFDRTGKVISRSALFSWIIIAIGVTGAYLPAATGWNLGKALIHPVAVAAYTAAGAIGLWYISVGYRKYENKFHRSIDTNFLLSTLFKASSTASFKGVEIKETDAEVSREAKEKFSSLKGYAYINALFFARHHRQLVKPVYYRLIAAAVLFVTAVVFLAVNRESAVALSKNLASLLPFFVYIMYFMTVADKAARAMFYNCDKDMLRYAYYRQPQTILRNFKIRLLRVSLYNVVIAGAVCLGAAVFCALCGTSIFTADLLLFCMTIILLSVLFTAHHLCLYYIFQPYSESLQIKNPFYSIINVGMYVLCFMCLQIETGGFIFTMATLTFTILYIIGALVLVYRRAPKSFRIK